MLNFMLRWIAVAAVAATLAACGTPPRAPSPPASVPAPEASARALPPWTPGAVHSYERQSPGMGVSRRYESAAGWADLYVYDLRRSWMDGTVDPGFAAHFERTIADVREVARRGRYTELQFAEPNDTVLDGHPMRRVRFSLRMDGRPLQSAIYLTARGGRLLKLRISVDPASGFDVDALAEDFLRGYFKRVAIPGGVSA